MQVTQHLSVKVVLDTLYFTQYNQIYHPKIYDLQCMVKSSYHMGGRYMCECKRVRVCVSVLAHTNKQINFASRMLDNTSKTVLCEWFSLKLMQTRK